MQQSSLMIRALRREPVERPPVWLMRQAGRYLSEYRELKQQHGFLGMCKTPELAAEVTLQPMRAFDMDAAIIFSDILLPTECLGIKVEFNPGPIVHNPVKSLADVQALSIPSSLANMTCVFDALRQVKSALGSISGPPKALIGFAGAPWTLACYLTDQGPYKHFAGTQVLAHTDPKAVHLLLDKLTLLITDYLLAQAESGADVLQLFDTWGGNLSLEDYRRFSLPYNQRILAAVKKAAPTILYANGSSHLLPALKESGADCISVDWRTDLLEARNNLAPTQAIQGNFDPTHLFGSSADVVANTNAMLKQLAGTPGYIANLGHGVLQHTPRENVGTFVQTVKQYGQPGGGR